MPGENTAKDAATSKCCGMVGQPQRLGWVGSKMCAYCGEGRRWRAGVPSRGGNGEGKTGDIFGDDVDGAGLVDVEVRSKSAVGSAGGGNVDKRRVMVNSTTTETTGPAVRHDVTIEIHVRSRFIELSENIRTGHQGWGDTAMRALLKTRAKITDTSRRKLAALLQWESIDDVVGKEARGWIRRWMVVAEGEGKVKQSILTARDNAGR